MNRSHRRYRSAAALCALAFSLALSGCGKTKPSNGAPAHTTAAAGTAPGTAPGASTTASSDAVTSDTSVSTDSAAAASEAVPADSGASDSTPGDTAAATTNTEASGAVAGPSVDATKIAGQIAAFGIVDKTKVDCVTKAAGNTPVADGTMPVGLLKGIMTCAPEALADTSVPALKEAVPTMTDKQASCVAFATFKVLAGLSDTDFKAAFSTGSTSAIPDDLKKKAKLASKDCGLSDADLTRAMKG